MNNTLVNFRHDENATKIWCNLSNQRGMTIAELRQLTNLGKVECAHAQLSEIRVQKDNVHRVLLDAALEVTSVPKLINLSTSISVSKDTETCLTSRFKSGMSS